MLVVWFSETVVQVLNKAFSILPNSLYNSMCTPFVDLKANKISIILWKMKILLAQKCLEYISMYKQAN